MAPARVYAVFGLDGYAREIAAPRWGRYAVRRADLRKGICGGVMCGAVVRCSGVAGGVAGWLDGLRALERATWALLAWLGQGATGRGPAVR
jgi:hypothetical protein